MRLRCHDLKSVVHLGWPSSFVPALPKSNLSKWFENICSPEIGMLQRFVFWMRSFVWHKQKRESFIHGNWWFRDIFRDLLDTLNIDKRKGAREKTVHRSVCGEQTFVYMFDTLEPPRAAIPNVKGCRSSGGHTEKCPQIGLQTFQNMANEGSQNHRLHRFYLQPSFAHIQNVKCSRNLSHSKKRTCRQDHGNRTFWNNYALFNPFVTIRIAANVWYLDVFAFRSALVDRNAFSQTKHNTFRICVNEGLHLKPAQV